MTWRLTAFALLLASSAAVQPPPAPASSASPLQNATYPVPIYEPRPQYTDAARRAGITGVVVLECVVLPDGTASNIRIVRSLDSVYGLDAEAIATLKQWRFKPGTKDRIPVPVTVTVELTFTLPERTPARPALEWPPEFAHASRDTRPWVAFDADLGALHVHLQHPRGWNVTSNPTPQELLAVVDPIAGGELRIRQPVAATERLEGPLSPDQLGAFADRMRAAAVGGGLDITGRQFGQTMSGGHVWIWIGGPHDWFFLTRVDGTEVGVVLRAHDDAADVGPVLRSLSITGR